jgi:hypothetical protein
MGAIGTMVDANEPLLNGIGGTGGGGIVDARDFDLIIPRSRALLDMSTFQQFLPIPRGFDISRISKPHVTLCTEKVIMTTWKSMKECNSISKFAMANVEYHRSWLK